MLSAGLHRRSLDHATRQRTEYTDENGCGRSSCRSIPEIIPSRFRSISFLRGEQVAPPTVPLRLNGRVRF